MGRQGAAGLPRTDRFAVAIAATAALMMGAVQASNLSRTEVLQPETPVDGGDFGAVVAGTYSNPSGPIAVTSRRTGGSIVYVFKQKPGGGWQEKSTYAYIPEAGTFGETLAITRQQVIVGIPDYAGDDGTVNVYKLIAGEVSGLQPPALIQQLHPETFGSEEFFGTALALRRNILVIGAPGSENNLEQKVYVYRSVGADWQLEQVLRQPRDTSGDRGRTLATDGNRIAATGPNGSAFVYIRSGTSWSIEQQFDRFALAGPDTAAMEQASAIGIDRDWLAISTPGKIHMFHRKSNPRKNTWVKTQALTVPMPAIGFPFAPSHQLVVAGNRMLVGIPSENRAFVYQFANGSWQQQKVLVPDGTGPGQSFGRTVAFDGSRAIVGAEGSVYVFR